MPQIIYAQATCGSCATANCVGVKQYANKSDVLTGLNKVWKTYSPTLTSTTGAFTVYVTITTDAWGQVGVMQEFQVSGATTGVTAQLQAVAATRSSVLYAVSDVNCTNAIYPPNIGNDGCSTTYNPAWTNLAPNTSYKLALTTNLSGLASGYTYSGFNIRFYNAVRPIASFNFNCGTATYLGTFTANGIAGQQGALTIPITSATAGTATLNVTGTGFTGTVTTNIAAGQTSVSIPITYDGTGVANTRVLTVTSAQGTGTCTPSVIVDPQLATFAFNCATASLTGTFIANNLINQNGTITIPITGTTQGLANFTVSGNGFSGSYTTTLTTGQTAVTFPIKYDGSGAARNHFVTITSAQATGTCSTNILVVPTAGTFTFNCGTASMSGNFVANGATAQGGYLTIPMTLAQAGKTTINVSGAGFTGTLTTFLTTNQTQVSIPIKYDGSGVAGSRPLSISSAQGVGTCPISATVAAPLPAGAITFNCPTTAPILGSFTANGTSQNGLMNINFTTQTAGQITFTIAGGGFSGSYVTSVVAGQTNVTMLVSYDGSGVSGNHAVTITSSQATGTCAMNALVKPLFDFACGNYNTSSSFTADGTTQNGTLVVPLSNVSAGTVNFSVSGGGFTGSLTAVLQDSQRFVAIPVVYDGSSPIGAHDVSITSPQVSGTCTVSVKVKDPAANGCDFLMAQPVSFLVNSQTTLTGYSTEYILVDSNGVIKYRTATMPFSNVSNGTYNGYAVNFSGTPPNMNVGTNIASMGGSCVNLSNALSLKVCAAYMFSCGGSTYQGPFVANGQAGQMGFIYVTLLNALAIPTTINVASGGFVGAVKKLLTVGNNTVAVPVTYDGSGSGGVVQVAISGFNAAGNCGVGVDVFPPPPPVPFTLNCGTPVINGIFIANSSVQSGSVTIPLTGALAGTTNFTITGTGFTGGLVNTVLTAGQTSISIPIIFDGRGPASVYSITITSPNITASCTTPVTVIDVVATFTFNCGAAAATGTLLANSVTGQTATLRIPLTNTTRGTASFAVTGTGFTGSLATTLTDNQAFVDIPITYDGGGVPRNQALTVTSPEATGTCTPSVPIVCPAILAPTIAVTQPTCAAPTGTITVTNPISGVTYSFNNGTSYQASATINGLAANTYSILTKNTISGCISVATSTTINAKPVPVAPTLTVTQPSCGVTTGTITVNTPSTGVTYSFDNGATFQASNIKSGLAAATTYQVVVKDNSSNCVSAATPSVMNAILTVPTAPTTIVTQPTCGVTTGTITVTSPSSGVTYSFDNGATFQPSNIKSGLAAATTYQVVVKDDVSNCVSTATATVIVAQPATPTIGLVAKGDPSVLSCPLLNNGVISVSATGANLEYSKDNGLTWQVSNMFTGVTANTYVLQVRDSVSNCVASYSANPVVLTAPICPTNCVVPKPSITSH